MPREALVWSRGVAQNLQSTPTLNIDIRATGLR
jgi:hypothetical protein